MKSISILAIVALLALAGCCDNTVHQEPGDTMEITGKSQSNCGNGKRCYCYTIKQLRHGSSVYTTFYVFTDASWNVGDYLTIGTKTVEPKP